MDSEATQRLIDAAATLEPADRALLNMWVNQGLHDRRIAGLTGIEAVSLAARRDRIVLRLGGRLGLPPSDVRAALAEIAATSRQAGASSGGRPVATDRPSVSPPASAPAAAASGSPPPGPRRRRRVSTAVAALVVALVAVVVVATSSGNRHRVAPRAAAAAAPTTRTATTTPPSTTTAPATTVEPPPVPGARSSEPLVRLPGVVTTIGGWVGLIGTGGTAHPTLGLSVRVFPIATRGHYEVWLYNSILDSHPLGSLRLGTYTVTYALPSHARRYRWIDVSFQPVGVVNHSGESELRAPNPAYATGAVQLR